jgi:hypothetical protein
MGGRCKSSLRPLNGAWYLTDHVKSRSRSSILLRPG